MLKGEQVKIQQPSFMMPDSRQFELSGFDEKNGLLRPKFDLFPSEGAIYLTNYRILFHGISLEYDNHLTIRSIPIRKGITFDLMIKSYIFVLEQYKSPVKIDCEGETSHSGPESGNLLPISLPNSLWNRRFSSLRFFKRSHRSGA